jgi:hypothetical protein
MSFSLAILKPGRIREKVVFHNFSEVKLVGCTACLQSTIAGPVFLSCFNDWVNIVSNCL